MTDLVHELLTRTAGRTPEAVALRHGDRQWTYAQVATSATAVAHFLRERGIGRGERVAIYLPKRVEAVASLFGAALAGAAYVPVNPLLKSAQVGHILRDCNVRCLVTARDRARDLAAELAHCPDLRHVLLVDSDSGLDHLDRLTVSSWDAVASAPSLPGVRVIDADIAAILYTSGSTGKPKGVVLSHRNITAGAASVAQYLENTADDRLLAVLPLSFDYGMSQITTAFLAGASVTLLDYLLPKDVLTTAARDRITGIAGVPPLWAQLAELTWPAELNAHLRYLTNSGGAMPRATLAKLRASVPSARVFLMYGLTEAFRSTYLPPSELDRRPDSIGKAIPNAEILVVRPDGTACADNEPGELVHRGALVALGYWNDSQKTAERYRPLPGQDPGLVLPELAVWSGDTVRRDEEGFLYFIGRRDEMIKTSGYRVSPTEVEEVLYATGLVTDAVAIGIPHPELGQAIAVIAAPAPARAADTQALLAECRSRLPNFMVPHHIEWRTRLPRNANGKFDRKQLALELAELFTGAQQ